MLKPYMSKVGLPDKMLEQISARFPHEINKKTFLERIRVAVESGDYSPFDQLKTLLDFVYIGQKEGWLEKPEPELEHSLSDLILHCEGDSSFEPYFGEDYQYSTVSSHNPSDGQTCIVIAPDHCTVRIDSMTKVSMSFGYYHEGNGLVVFFINDKFMLDAEE